MIRLLKLSKMKMSLLNRKFSSIWDLFQKSNCIVLVTHQSPDVDALASALALAQILRSFQKRAWVFCSEPISAQLQFLPGKELIKAEPITFSPDLLIALDYGNWQRLVLPQEPPDRIPVVTLDHHPQDNQRGVVVICEPCFSSTCEILYFLLKYKGIDLDRMVAFCLLSGIVFDTGGFSHANFSSQTLAVVQDLMLQGAPLNQILRAFVGVSQPNSFRAWHEVFSRMKLEPGLRLATCFIPYRVLRRQGLSAEDFSQLSCLLGEIAQTQIGLLLIEHQPGRIKGKLRAQPHSIWDVSQIAQKFGGGGHRLAAGFETQIPPDKILGEVKKILREC